MKYIVIIGDGMADFPLDELGGKTPLMAAHKPFMNMMAKDGFCGKVSTVPQGFSPGSDVAAMSIFGYNPAEYYTGRAPIEAAGMGIELRDLDVAFRCNLVSLDMNPDHTIMADYSGGHVTTEEAKVLINALNEALGRDEFEFFPGVSYRHIMVWRNGKWQMSSTPPHDITGRQIGEYLPKGEAALTALGLMKASQKLLGSHPVNELRKKAGKLSANSIWLWGQGKKTVLPPFAGKFHLKGATVAAVDLVKGVSRLAGFDAPYVAGATGYLDTDYGAKANKALALLKDHDIVYVHIEAPDEASHNGDVKEKIKAIERIDSLVVGELFQKARDTARFLIVTDHATPISMKTHYAQPVPFVIYDANRKVRGCETGYDERTGDTVISGEEMITILTQGQKP
ncbi:MAG TPA: cofactor-independent phosphoglycerate mutase [Syntrophorhabdaceae bacterium]|nr:cofactor-independent phosphoglycerate mutase [Syntrophorhabdaceae bacterium]